MEDTNDIPEGFYELGIKKHELHYQCIELMNSLVLAYAKASDLLTENGLASNESHELDISSEEGIEKCRTFLAVWVPFINWLHQDLLPPMMEAIREVEEVDETMASYITGLGSDNPNSPTMN